MRFWLMASAAFLLAAALFMPRLNIEYPSYDLLVVVDITGSMAVRDVTLAGKPASRLDQAKWLVRQMAARLPCRSRIGLGIFTERQPFLLIEPIELCDGFAPFDAAVAGLDRRMAWEGDSRIASGLMRSIAMAHGMPADLVFITDGQEAPPVRADRPPVFDGVKGEVRGLLLGVGGAALSPIPKYDADGHEIGFYAMEDVPQENREGPPPPGMEEREGYNPRNAPYGAAQPEGTEHLSSLKEDYLKDLAKLTGLAYARAGDPAMLMAAITANARSHMEVTAEDIRFIPAGMALLTLLLIYMMLPLFDRLSGHRRSRVSRQFTKG
ncbi:vWA domain-containing protein [Arboricoccus pini]|uniref:vWA domain-containing protein n=1 Tax=Arboricoccus pini TaxID=1963835 RepID=UPI001FAFE7C5|nr:vWA domain-containing protein [Arboricoccus pini]